MDKITISESELLKKLNLKGYRISICFSSDDSRKLVLTKQVKK